MAKAEKKTLKSSSAREVAVPARERPDEVVAIKSQADQISKTVMAIQVRDDLTYRRAGALVVDLDAAVKRIKEYWKGPKDAAHKAHAEICAKEKELLGPLEQHRRALTVKINAFLDEQERVRQEEQDRLDREHRERIAKEEEALQKKIEKAQAKGNTAKAAELEDQLAVIDRTPEIALTVAKTTDLGGAQVTRRTELEITVVDEYALLKEIVERRAPLTLLGASLKDRYSDMQLKQFAKLHQLTAFPGLAIRTAQRATFRGGKQ